ncbi:RING-finger, DEAD-like helicase, PHD and SNF2 domain-containing protein [Actinidia rufa]|uniref:RING-finger, DEAD-like helicase, PHD and SNF2 domain-containing protein n=1 Tax=Actinidia rufa TaxID=165716 RepID=A0A7J0EF17_9ERIC|nr:RING-finger, DEAD-like helicase, PHD and SNF2 domain-containing protein [Actinidia rufa]
MGRRKQVRPHRSVGILGSHESAERELNEQNASEYAEREESFNADKPFFVNVDRTSWGSNEHFDISEVILTNLYLSEEFSGFELSERFYQDSRYSLRFRLCNVDQFVGRMRLGHWPVIPASDIFLEFTEKCTREDMVDAVIMSGTFDGPDEGVSGLVHLISLKFLTLRPVLGFKLSEEISSLRVRVEILKSAFDACESLLDTTRQLWKRSMMSVMSWLRPEVITSEARYEHSELTEQELDSRMEMDNDSLVRRKRAKFDVAGFYEAIKPSKEYPTLEDDIPDLLPEFRPYQRRAAYWMVQREQGSSECSNESERNHFLSPLCMPVNLIDTCSTMFYNPYSGNVALHPESSLSYVFGGILADEMGLGKTVELLACIFAHRKSATEGGNNGDSAMKIHENQKIKLKRLRRERIECVCGAVSESSRYKGLWVQCDICDAWQHADCVGYSTRAKTLKSTDSSKGQRCKGKQMVNSRKRKSRKNDAKIVMMDGDHICQLCSELIQATDAPFATGATLIVCPAPILPQWHAEIIRHTKPGSLKTCVYEGVRLTSLSNTSLIGISELLGADVVLTTYDVLKEDLSHDSDRHEGDRRFMRFQKRYPVIPTLLTKIFWWRICLDEAQMVESNAAAATEMVQRLHAKYRWCITGTPIQRKLDDLYGLLRFLKANPFDVLRWWIEVLRDPYERGDAGAMRFMHNFFKQIMWRSSKLHVAEELQLPPQEECLTRLSFSPIEEHFYQRQHETCVDYAREVIESFKDDIFKRTTTGSMSSDAASDPFITHVEAAKLLNSLLKLRQACCHPQVGSSGLRSLQQSPMTMDEILSVLVGKIKVEGEDALRKAVVALNGLAGVAIIKQDFSQAASLYREALTLAEEHSEDFRLDPLLNIHIHHNLSDVLPLTLDHSQQFRPDAQCSEISKDKLSRMYDVEECDRYDGKREKTSGEDSSDLTFDAESFSEFTSDPQDNDCNYNKELDAKASIHSRPSHDGCLQTACENLKQKFLSVFKSKLSLAQQEFRKSHVLVCEAFRDRRKQDTVWWLESLHHIEQNKDSSSELVRKIGEAVSGTLNVSRTSRIASCFRSITALKYYIQTGLDSLEDSRKTLLDRLLEIDQSMGNPREEDIERVRYCPNCQANGDGLICVHCELDELFQVYEARLFRLNKGHDGGVITSVEEAVDLQKKKSALNRFYWTLSRTDKNSTSSSVKYDDNGGKRDVGEKVVVSRSPSELEVVLGIIKSFSKTLLGRDGMVAATKQLHLLEGMRKEYAQARSLAIAQAQVLRAHDEIKMATSRLRLRENGDDMSIDALSPGELDAASVENSSDKFLALTSLSRIKGQLRYLKGLVESKQKMQVENPNSLSLDEVAVVSSTSVVEKETGCVVKADEEACPVCQEKLANQKMVFQCGHVTCCKCLFAMTEQRLLDGKFRAEWVMCPTCRQHTDFGNIAFADDRQNNSDSSFHGRENSEASITVHGSYGTKIEAITRRILWITSTDPKAKLLVFSSWNDVLDVMEHAFNANNISYIRMKGGRKAHVAISHFKGQSSAKGRSKMHGQQQETKSVQVLLLLIQHGANGLNLLEAQHVILVEPLLNPAAEAQAIGRVHRIGQKNKTLVHRFIVKNTVEESIYKLNRSRSTSSYISGNTKNQDQPVLTLKDVESLFTITPSTTPESEAKPSGSLMHLPPSVAAVVAAERRLMEQTEDPC